MKVLADKALGALQARVTKEAETCSRASERQAFLRFIEPYYGDAWLAVSPERGEAELARIALSHWRWGRKRLANTPLVRVYSQAAQGELRPCSVVELVLEDLPFLVASVGITVRSLGYAVHWLLHPLIAARRDAKGRLFLDDKADPESWLRLEIDLLPDVAAEEELQQALETMLAQLQQVVADWTPMRRKASEVASLVEEGRRRQAPVVADFLRWLEADHFTFLGYQLLHCHASRRRGAKKGLGLLRQQSMHLLAGLSADCDLLGESKKRTQQMVISKSQRCSSLHHPGRMDVVVVREWNHKGELLAVHGFLGLFSGEVYETNPKRIPLLEAKLAQVRERAALRPGSYAAKSLKYILESYPRDELFQADMGNLYRSVMGILALRERAELGLFLRYDAYGSFVSAQVYLPQQRYSVRVQQRMAALLMEWLKGESWDCRVDFMRKRLARLHFTLQLPLGSRYRVDEKRLRDKLADIGMGWQAGLRHELEKRVDAQQAATLWLGYREGFSEVYQDRAEPQEAAADVLQLNDLTEQSPIAVKLIPHAGGDGSLWLKVYVHGEAATLSELLPRLEFFGLEVIAEESYEVTGESLTPRWIQRLELRHPRGSECAASPWCDLFAEAFLQLVAGEVANDGLNSLTLSAGLPWQKVRLLRALCRYLMQTDIGISYAFMVQTLRAHPGLAAKLVALFEVRFGLKTRQRRQQERRLVAEFRALLDEVPSLDADRILRGLLSVVLACVRTNFYQQTEGGGDKSWISFKLRSAEVAELPDPRPLFETFVYSSEMEGIHLRAGPVSRGGLRWSDRREDFRTEVLGLMKTQQVKNALIVPQGAKGGFVVKHQPAELSRLEQGIHCYQQFIRGLLDVTDNRRAGKIVPPKQLVRHDDDDSYLVVAADKGTASFSDIANAEAQAYGYWLGDAFASGGSQGYDHKVLGITARGGWESVKRHFAEQGHDIQTTPFSVVGIGDMAGDVFGNGMLLSPQIRLLAAFNHRHIFIDPAPDVATSFAERQRLFRLKGSAWSDYNAKLLSPGGAIYERSAKRIELSQQAMQALDCSESSLTPNELIRVTLKAPVDLWWNGGIGTYVKASGESHADVGDHANDSLRIDAGELRCRVVGEGGNLGLTQKARIEYARLGGRLNSDFVDNAAGVGSSDREVNIKIPLNILMAEGKLKPAARSKLLKRMTRDLARRVLAANYDQALVISLMEDETVERLGEQAQLIRYLEHHGGLDRQLECLPNEEELNERHNRREGLARPELSVLMAYSKMLLSRQLQQSALVKDPYFETTLFDYFPSALCDAYPESLREHGLREAIIATRLTNQLVNHLGVSFPHRPVMDAGVSYRRVVAAYVIVSCLLDVDDWWRRINRASSLTMVQRYALQHRITFLQKRLLWWLLDHAADWQEKGIDANLATYRQGVDELRRLLPGCLSGAYRQHWQSLHERLRAEGVPAPLARASASIPALTHLFDIAGLSERHGCSVKRLAAVYFALGEALQLPWLLEAVEKLHSDGRWQALARSRLRKEFTQLHADLAHQLLSWSGSRCDQPKRLLQAWLAAGGEHTTFVLSRLDGLTSSRSGDFASLSVALGELRSLLGTL